MPTGFFRVPNLEAASNRPECADEVAVNDRKCICDVTLDYCLGISNPEPDIDRAPEEVGIAARGQGRAIQLRRTAVVAEIYLIAGPESPSRFGAATSPAKMAYLADGIGVHDSYMGPGNLGPGVRGDGSSLRMSGRALVISPL